MIIFNKNDVGAMIVEMKNDSITVFPFIQSTPTSEPINISSIIKDKIGGAYVNNDGYLVIPSRAFPYFSVGNVPYLPKLIIVVKELMTTIKSFEYLRTTYKNASYSLFNKLGMKSQL